MRRGLSIQGIALASARHPRRTIAAWGAAFIVAIVAIVALLGGSLATDNHPTDNRQSQRATALLDHSFSAGSRAANAELVVIHSVRYTVQAPAFRAVVVHLTRDLSSIGGVAHVTSYLNGGGAALVSHDRHAVLVQVSMPGSNGIDDVVGAVGRAGETPGFSATSTSSPRATCSRASSGSGFPPR